MAKCRTSSHSIPNGIGSSTPSFYVWASGEKVSETMKRWDLKRTRAPNYTIKNHTDWVDHKNGGVSHFGIHPDLLPRDVIRMDTFHMNYSVTQKLMGQMRKFLLNQSTDLIEDFSQK
eukprot:11242351-Ditylum_brightwellii.AAC.1